MRTSLLKIGANPGIPTPKRGEAIVALAEDITSWPTLADDGVSWVGNFAFAPGTNFFKIYMTPATQAATYESSGNPDGMGTINKFVGEHPGSSREAMSFLKKYNNKGFIIFYGGCDEEGYKTMGNKCLPMILTVSGKDDRDGNVNTLSFEQEMVNDQLVRFYDGDVTFAEPEVLADGTVNASVAGGSVYYLPSTAVTSSVDLANTDLEDGAVITLIGGGGAGPMTLAQDTVGPPAVLLKGGTNWVALDGARIDLRVVVSDKTYFVEIARA